MPDPDPVEKPPESANRPAGPTPNWLASGGPAPVTRTKALVFGSLFIVLLLGVLVGILFLPAAPVGAYLVTLPLQIYDDAAIPPAVFAEQDSRMLAACFPENAEIATTAVERAKFREKLKAIQGGNLRADWGDNDRRTLQSGRPFLFHIVGHAAIANSVPYILPIKARLTDDPAREWIPLKDILDAMAECPTPKKLLLLDLSRPRTNAFNGIFQDEVSPKLHDWLQANRTELPCPVLVSSSAGEESHVIPQVKASAFAFYVTQGLMGRADGYAKSPADGKVNVLELAEFVRIRTVRWARQNRDRRQEPKLYEPNAFANFDLVLEYQPPSEEDPASIKSEFARSGLVDAWVKRESLTPEAVRRAAPQLVQWASTVLEAERVFESTNEPPPPGIVEIANRWWGEVLRAARPTVVAQYPSLSAVVPPARPAPAANAPPDPTLTIRLALERYADVAVATADKKPDEKEAAVKRNEFAAAVGMSPGPVATKIVWEWLVDGRSRPSARAVQFAASCFEITQKGSPEFFVELVATNRAAQLDSGPFVKPESSREAIEYYLKAERIAGRVLARGSVGYEWIAPSLAAADDAKLAAEKLLFAADSSEKVRTAGEKFRAVIVQWADLESRLVALAAARNTVEDAQFLLASTAVSVAEFDVPSSRSWVALAESTTLLANWLYRPPVAAWDIDELESLTKSVAEQSSPLSSNFQPSAIADTLAKAKGQLPAGLREYQGTLLTPSVVGLDRGKLWDATDQIRDRFHVDTRKNADIPDDLSEKPTKSPTVVPAAVPARDRRIGVAVGLLKLSGVPDAYRLSTVDETAPGRNSPEQRQFLANEVRTAWLARTIQKWTADYTARSDWEKLDRLARSLPVLASRTAPDESAGTDRRTAAARRREREEQQYRLWLLAHYPKYELLRSDVAGAKDGYRRTLQETKPRYED